MVQLAKIVVAWGLTLSIYVALATALFGQRGSPEGGFREGLLGVGFVVGLPTLAFAILAVWPVAALLQGITKPWLFVLGATTLFGLAMLILTAVVMPAGWNGASQSLIFFAILLGLIWGAINALTMRSDQFA